MKDRKSESKRFFKNSTFMFALILILIYIVLSLLKMWFFGTITIEEFLENLLNSLLGIILPLFLFDIVYEYLTKSHISNEISSKVSEAIILNDDLIDCFDEEIKIKFLKKTLSSIFRNKKDEVIYNAHIHPYIDKEYSFRSEFIYDIQYHEGHKCSSKRWNFSSKSYYFVYQNLSYKKAFLNDSVDFNNLRIGFTFDEETVDDWFNDNSIFFREVLQLEERERNRFESFTEKDLCQFANDYMSIDVRLNYESLGLVKTEFSPDKRGFYLEFSLGREFDLSSYGECHFRLSFTIPQHKAKKRILAIISEPTFRPEIRFRYLPHLMNVSVIPFFDEKNIVKSNNSRETKLVDHVGYDTIQLRLDDWVVPRSGVVFVWEDQQ